MKEVRSDNNTDNSDVALSLEILNHYLGVSLKLIHAYLGDIQASEYLARKDSLIKFLENPDLVIEGPDNVNLRDLQNFLQRVGEQNPAQREAVLASLKEHFRLQLQDRFSDLPADLIERKILSRLEKSSQKCLALTNRRNFSIFADFVLKDMAPQLLLNVVHGNLDDAEKLMLKMQVLMQRANRLSLNVSLQHASVTDYSLRHFPAFKFNLNPAVQNHLNPNANALKLTRWIGDWYIYKIFLMNLPQEVKENARAQIHAVKLTGIDYEYDLLLDGEVTQKMADEQGTAVLDGRASVILRGCEVVMLSLPENENIDEAVLREISAKFDEQPILIKQGEKIYLYGFANKNASKVDREWCLSEMSLAEFLKLHFPKECGNPERKYLALRKAGETLTETMHTEIVKNHGEISYPYSFILMSHAEEQEEVDEIEFDEKDLNEKDLNEKDLAEEKLKNALAKKALAEKKFEKELTQIATANPNQPILVRQGESIFLYQFKEEFWMTTKLNDPGFQNLAFPKEGYCSLKLPPRKTNETLTQEMRHEMSLAHNFVDYRVQCREVVNTAQGIKTLAHVQVLGERRYDYHPLIEALKDYIEIRTLWENADRPEGALKEAVFHQWNRVMGLIQCYATAFLAQQYCHPKRSFENVKFEEAEFRGKDRCLEFYDYVNQKIFFWFLRDSGLGSDFGISRLNERLARYSAHWGRPLAWGFAGGLNPGAVLVDLQAVETLCQVIFERLASVEQEYLDKALAPSNSFG